MPWLIHIKPLTDKPTITVSVCPKCGIIEKSGKRSCCGRGGSWFNNCGGAGNVKLQHTWYEGIQACKARPQSKTLISGQLNVVQQKDINSSHGASMPNSKAVTVAAKTSIMTSTYGSDNVSTHTSVATSITTQVHVNTLEMIVCINIVFTIISFWVCYLISILHQVHSNSAVNWKYSIGQRTAESFELIIVFITMFLLTWLSVFGTVYLTVHQLYLYYNIVICCPCSGSKERAINKNN